MSVWSLSFLTLGNAVSDAKWYVHVYDLTSVHYWFIILCTALSHTHAASQMPKKWNIYKVKYINRPTYLFSSVLMFSVSNRCCSFICWFLVNSSSIRFVSLFTCTETHTQTQTDHNFFKDQRKRIPYIYIPCPLKLNVSGAFRIFSLYSSFYYYLFPRNQTFTEKYNNFSIYETEDPITENLLVKLHKVNGYLAIWPT